MNSWDITLIILFTSQIIIIVRPKYSDTTAVRANLNRRNSVNEQYSQERMYIILLLLSYAYFISQFEVVALFLIIRKYVLHQITRLLIQIH